MSSKSSASPQSKRSSAQDHTKFTDQTVRTTQRPINKGGGGLNARAFKHQGRSRSSSGEPPKS